MLIGFNRVAIDDASWFATAGSIGTDIALSDGKPSTRTRVSNSSYLSGFSANFDDTSNVRIIAIIGLTVSVNGGAQSSSFPAGSEVEIVCGTYAEVFDPLNHIGPDGRCSIYAVLPATISASAITVGFQVGAVSQPHYVDCGEIAIFDAIDVRARPGVSWSLVDPSETMRTIGQQLHTAARRPYRRLTTEICPTSEATSVGAVGADLESVRYALSRDKVGVVCLDDSSQATVTRSTVFGRVTVGDINHVQQSAASNRLYTASLVAEEIPAGDAA